MDRNSIHNNLNAYGIIDYSKWFISANIKVPFWERCALQLIENDDISEGSEYTITSRKEEISFSGLDRILTYTVDYSSPELEGDIYRATHTIVLRVSRADHNTVLGLHYDFGNGSFGKSDKWEYSDSDAHDVMRDMLRRLDLMDKVNWF